MYYLRPILFLDRLDYTDEDQVGHPIRNQLLFVSHLKGKVNLET